MRFKRTSKFWPVDTTEGENVKPVTFRLACGNTVTELLLVAETDTAAFVLASCPNTVPLNDVVPEFNDAWKAYVNTCDAPPGIVVTLGCGAAVLLIRVGPDATNATPLTRFAAASPVLFTATNTVNGPPVPTVVGEATMLVMFSCAGACTVSTGLVATPDVTVNPLLTSTPDAVPASVTVPDPTAEYVHTNVALLRQQADEFKPAAVVTGPDGRDGLQGAAREVLVGSAGMVELCRRPNVDLVVVASAGEAGLLPTLAALESGKLVALANKESLIAAAIRTVLGNS